MAALAAPDVTANYKFLERLRSTDAALGGGAPPDVARVQIVSNNAYQTSREFAPLMSLVVNYTAPAAGTHQGVALWGHDTKNQNCLIDLVSVMVRAATGPVRMVTIPLSAITTATTAAINPFGEGVFGGVQPDPEVKWDAMGFTCSTINLPANATGAFDFNATTPWFSHSVSEASPMLTLPSPDRAFCFINVTAAEAVSFFINWRIRRS